MKTTHHWLVLRWNQGPVSWRPTTVKWRQFSQSNRHSTIGTQQIEYHEALPSSENVQSLLTSSFADDGNASWYSVCRVSMVEWRLDCENRRHLTVVGLHDTGPWLAVSYRLSEPVTGRSHFVCRASRQLCWVLRNRQLWNCRRYRKLPSAGTFSQLLVFNAQPTGVVIWRRYRNRMKPSSHAQWNSTIADHGKCSVPFEYWSKPCNDPFVA